MDDSRELEGQKIEPEQTAEDKAVDNQAKQKQKKKNKKKRKRPPEWLVWGLTVTFISFALTVLFSFLTELVITDESPIYICVIVLIVLLVVNIGCDLLANAIISCNSEAFHAMASNKIKGAKRSVFFCKHSSRLSSIFADVIGDICGIVSGAASTALVAYFAVKGDIRDLIISVVISGIVGALTVGGKAFFKNLAIKFNKQIVFGFAKFTTFFKKEK